MNQFVHMRERTRHLEELEKGSIVESLMSSTRS